jgi:hypothetical protein
MWWSENAVPRWLERSVVAAFLIVSGFIGALLASWVVMWLFFAPIAAVVPDRLGAWMLWHPESLYAAALACALALALVVDRLAFARR